MLHERIGDRTNDADRICPETPVEFLLEENHPRRSILIGLVVHAVVGNQPYNGAEFGKPAHFCINRAMEGVGLRLAWSMGMLNQIG